MILGFILGLLVGFYMGAGVVTAITVRTIDGKEARWVDSLFVAFLWWFVLYEASLNDDED